MRNTNESGIAMITVLLVLMLMSALLVGFTTVVMSDQRYRFIDRDRGQAFYAASAGVEKLTADLGNLFLENVAPTAAQVTALTAAAKMPSISGITFAAATAPAALPASQLTPYHCARAASGPAGRHEDADARRHQRLHHHLLQEQHDQQSDGLGRQPRFSAAPAPTLG